MTLRQKYKQLNNPISVKEMVVTSVYHTMQIEGQTVSKAKVESLYNQVQRENKAKRKA